jgi:16S rRNA (cytidine1402-2'-O)-methyltransferase
VSEEPPTPGSLPAGGALYVVATPIGNLGDVTVRALEVLRSVPRIAAEDTRITRRLLGRYDIDTPVVSYHARSDPTRAAELLGHLRGGGDLALVTDAGTPLVSDPGEALVASWAAEGGRVVPIPGPSAVLAAVAASAIAGPRWAFEGFLPRAGRTRRERLARIAVDDRGTILLEAPTRVAVTLRDLAATCGPSRLAAVCRELTKLHEQVQRGSLAELAEAVGAGRIPLRGEFTIVVAGAVPTTANPPPAGRSVDESAGPPEPGDPGALAEARSEVATLVAGGLTRSAAARRVAARTGLPRRELYRSGRRGRAGARPGGWEGEAPPGRG